MQRIKELYPVTQRLCGMIEPVGDSGVDGVRYENLKDTIYLTEQLINDIIDVARHKGAHEHTVNRSGNEANDFIIRLRERLEM